MYDPPKKYKNGLLFLFVAPPFLPLPGPPSALSGTAPVVRRRPPELSQDVSSLGGPRLNVCLRYQWEFQDPKMEVR